MGGTKEGGIEAAKTNKTRYGRDWYAKIGAKGGAHRSPDKGFGSMAKDKVSEAGRKGGTVSSRRGVSGGEGTSRSAKYTKRKRELTAYELHTQGSKS